MDIHNISHANDNTDSVHEDTKHGQNTTDSIDKHSLFYGFVPPAKDKVCLTSSSQ